MLNKQLNLLQNLKTIHGNFTSEKIPEAHMELIINAALRAPNAGNMQTYSIISIEDSQMMKQLFNNKGRYAGKGILHKGGYQQMNTTDIQHMINEYDQKDNHFGIPGLAHTQKEKNHLFEKIFGFWGDGGASLSSQQLFESLKNSGYMDAEELNK